MPGRARRVVSRIAGSIAIVLMSVSVNIGGQTLRDASLKGTDSAAALSRTVAAGEAWLVDRVTALKSLEIEAGATITAPAGQSLTMTVGGVETPIAAGHYTDVVLTPAASILKSYDGMGTKAKYDFRTAVYVNNGAYVPDKSIAAAAVGGKVTNTSADGVRVESKGPLFAAFMIDGDSTYTIRNPVIRMTGNGKNDFFGYGASIRAGGTSKVTIDGASIDNRGAVRTAIWVGDHANVTVNNADIEVHDGTLPSNYGWSWTKGGPTGNGDVMMEVPWMLGLRGNNRATLVVGHGTATYNNSHIRAQAWGAMSTDAVEEAVVNLNKCHIETIESGYGAYADGNSLIRSSGSRFDVATYGLILSGGSGIFTDGSVVNSRRIGVMAHGGSRGKLTIDKGSAFNTAEAVIQLKGSSPDILIDSASLRSQKGIILEMFPNDDPNKGGPGAGPAGPPPAAGAGPGGPGGMPKPMDNKYSSTNGTNDEDTTIRNSNLAGDFVNALTARSAMNISLVNSTVTGAITTGTSVHAVGPKGEKLVMQDSPDLYALIGEVNLTYGPTTAIHGATVSLDGSSRWVVSKTSYLNGLTLAPGAALAAAQGMKLKMTIDGAERGIVPGSYQGKIVLTPTAR